MHSSPLREEKSFLKGLFLFLRIFANYKKKPKLIYFNHRESGCFFKMVHLCKKMLTKPESLVSDYFILIKEVRVPLRTHKMHGGF